MNTSTQFLFVVFCLGCASYACRAGGFFLMRYVKATPRVKAALAAIPVSAMIGIMTPTVVAGRPAELAGIAVAIVLMKIVRHDLVAMAGGAAVVAIARAAGF